MGPGDEAKLIPGNGMLSTLDSGFHQNFHGHSVVYVPHTHIVHTSVFIDDFNIYLWLAMLKLGSIILERGVIYTESHTMYGSLYI